MNAEAVLAGLLPEHVLLAGMVLVVVRDLVRPGARDTFGIALLALAVAAGAALWLSVAGYAARPFPGQFSVAPADLLAKAVLLMLAIPVLLLSRDDFADGRFHVLLLSSLYGVCLMLSSDSFLTLFVGLELMSLPVYVLVMLAYRGPECAEAALKYLVLGGAASASLLMGAALLYGATGSLALATFATALAAPDPLVLAGAALVVAAFFLKAAVVPFHAWAPDAYQGASVPVTAYMATVVKAAVLLAVVRLFAPAASVARVADLVALLPLASIVWGNLAAMRQTSFRRMMAYSSIAHAGYLFYVLLGEAPGRYAAALFYVIAYGLMTVLAFAALPRRDDDAASDSLHGLEGLSGRAPLASLLIAASMLSLAGVPPLPGFVAKFFVFRNAMDAGYTTYAVLGLVASYLGLYFYLRVIQLMFMSAAGPAPTGRPRRFLRSASALCLLPAIALAVFPGWLIARL